MAKKNFTISTVATAPDPATTGTTLDVPSGKGSLFAEDEVALIFPDGEQPDITNAEIVLVTDVTADTLTITREQEGTTARTVVVGDIIFQQISAGNWNDLITAVGSNTTHRGLTNNPHSVDAGDIGVEAGATADQTGSEIKTAYEGEADTNAFTDAEETKVGHISVTQAVNLDTMESNIATNNDKITYPSAASDKLATIEESADVTDATNVNSAGATMNTDSDVKANSWTIDEDDMTSNVDTKVPTQQSVKAYTDAQGYTWQGEWATSTAYVLNDTVEYAGSGYVCVTAHTSGTWSADLSAGKWELFVEGLPTPNITTSTSTDLTGYLKGDGSNVSAETAATLLAKVYPVGSIYISTTSTNPNTVFGFGTWSAFGAGKTLVSLDSADADFDTSEETGGSKTHTLTTAEMPSHRHSVSITSGTQSASHTHTGANGMGVHSSLRWETAGVTYSFVRSAPSGSSTITKNQSASHTHSVSGNTGYYGNGDAHSIVQPYITVYMWKRTA